MKRMMSMIFALTLMAGFTACGSSQAASESTAPASSAPASSAETNSASNSAPEAASSDRDNHADPNNGEPTVGMIYFLDLKDSSIMAACYDDAGTEAMGGDYIKVYIDNAEITDADGNPMTLEDMNRGCLMDVTFPGVVTMSIPAQISATKIVVTNNEEDPDFPAENDIPDLFGTGKWWEPEVVNQAPDLVVQYKDSLGQYSQMIPYKTGDWSYGDDSSMEGGMSNAALDGQKPQDWFFDEYTTVKRTNFDTVKLVFAPQPDTMTVTVYRQDDPEDTGTEVPVSDSGEITLEDGDVNMVYVVSGTWQSENYQGSAVYGFLVTDGQ